MMQEQQEENEEAKKGNLHQICLDKCVKGTE